MNKYAIPLLFLMLITSIRNLNAQTDGVSIDYSGTPAREPKAIFQVNSNNQGAILPRMTAAQRVAIAPPASAKGMTVYQTDGTQGYFYWDGSQWLQLVTSASVSGLSNPSATIGLTPTNGSATTALRSDAAPALSQAIVPTWTGTHTFNNSSYSALFTGGNVGIGTPSPTERLDVNGNVKVASLAGTGNRLVHANSNGVLQANGAITKVDPIVIRGTGLNHNSNRLLKIGNTQIYNTSGGRGLTFTIIQKTDHSVVSTTNYDTYGSTTDANNLANALNNLNNNQIGVLTSYDAWENQVTTNLKDAFKRLGLYKALMTTVGGSRRTYAAIFEGSSNAAVPSASAVEVAHSADAEQPFSEVRGWLIDGGYVATSQVPSGLSSPVGTFALGVNESGDVGIGTASPTYKLHVIGRLKTTGINETSDARLKTNIAPISDALTNVLKMEGVTYNWKHNEFPEMGLNTDLQHGLIAQDLEKIVPELVLTDKEGWKSIEYTHLVPMLIEAIKELSTELNEQKSAYNTLKAQVDRIDNSLLEDQGSAQKQ